MTAPLTRAAHGSTRCVGCGKRFDMTPGVEVTVVEGEEQGWSHVDSAGQFRRSLTPARTARRWHTRCLEEFEAQNQAYPCPGRPLPQRDAHLPTPA